MFCKSITSFIGCGCRLYFAIWMIDVTVVKRRFEESNVNLGMDFEGLLNQPGLGPSFLRTILNSTHCQAIESWRG
jgi:hypothetical protein